MSRLGNMLGGGLAKSAGAKRGTIGDFAKKNPDFMKLDPAKRNEMLMNMQVEANMINKGSRNASTNGKELSKTAKDMMEKMLKKQLQKRQKEVVSIRACWFGNGRIDSKGRIFDANNKEVGRIDQDTMKITIGWSSIGKYKDDSFTLTKLSQKIAGMSQPASTASSGGGMGNFYGAADSGSGSGWW